MKRTLTVLAAVAAVAIGAIASPKDAEARGGGAVAAGVIGGLAAGAIIGSAAYGGGPYYAYAPGPYYGYGAGCHWRRERVWDGWGWRLRRVRVCY
ncbi:MAG: hypothetical protein JOZ70_12385 [Pseudolabrys sp.]|nr:hypothetical protein [Pseudolabrys sp.]MBV9956035.1 hypothetical protein [Pseudolabrys sp.]